MRIAPKGGYDNPRKRDYDRRVWATHREWCKRNRVVIADAQIFLMPSTEGYEISVAEDAGFRPENMHVCDMNPAIVATLKKRHPRITTYGVTASRAMERICENNVAIRCANFDFTKKLSQPSVEEFRLIATHGAFGGFTDRASIAVTFAKGREERATTNFVNLASDKTMETARLYWPLGDMKDFDVRRLLLVFRTLNLGWSQEAFNTHTCPEVRLIRAESYTSAKHPMLWSVWEVAQIMVDARQIFGDPKVMH